MKKIVLITILSFLLLSFGMQVFAQDAELPSPGLLPDNVFYFLKTWKEQIQLFFTFDAEKKAEQYIHLADVRLAEYQKMIEKGKEEIAQRVLAKYEKQLGHALSKAKELQNKGKDNQDLFQKIEDTTVKHISVLEKNMANVSENAKKGLEKALESSKKVAQEKAVQNFEVFEAKCIEAGGAPEVCVEFKVNLQSSKTLRTFCIEKGGPLEQCEKFPAQGFKSFEQIEAYCMESWGAPSELCASLVIRCRELGITTAEECFLVLSIATVKTSPAPSSSE
ncbi:MAG TPA: hypothetical protein ENH90_00655 [bacterium]|nr:hypothetical protein [bacterium]